MNTQRSNDEIREDLRRVASTATGFVHDAAMRLAGDFESLLSRLAAVEAWAMENEIAAPPLDWAGLAAILHPLASPTPTGPERCDECDGTGTVYLDSDGDECSETDRRDEVACPHCSGPATPEPTEETP